MFSELDADFCWKVWMDWQTSCETTVQNDICLWQKDELSEQLVKFVQYSKRISDLKVDMMHYILYGLQKYFFSVGLEWEILNDHGFNQFHEELDELAKMFTPAGEIKCKFYFRLSLQFLDIPELFLYHFQMKLELSRVFFGIVTS